MSRLLSLPLRRRTALPAVVAVLVLLGLALPASLTAQPQERRNFFGMHNLMDGGASIPEGMNWTRHMVGEGGYEHIETHRRPRWSPTGGR